MRDSANPASQFVQIDRLDDSQEKDLIKLYSQEWWTQGRGAADIETMLRHSDVIVGVCDRDTRRLVAFSRLLTDRVYKALLLDVIVDEAYRGAGLGKVLLDAVVNHPILRNVRHIELYCRPELVQFYARWGFEIKSGDLCFMRLAR
jgi:GNAT superfamily N-acetyltransferase